MTKKFVSVFLIFIIALSSPFALSFVADTTTYKVGDIVEFGSYPQSRVTDEELLSQLNSLDLVWHAFDNYYYGTGDSGTMAKEDYMRYANVEYNGESYRGIYFTKFRPVRTIHNPVSNNSSQDDNGYYTCETYWFKYEPIEWIIIDPIKGTMITKSIVDAQSFCNNEFGRREHIGTGYSTVYYSDSSYTMRCDRYNTSDIREWLNSSFVEEAFSLAEKQKLINIELNEEMPEEKACILSFDEVNDSYGFNNATSRVAYGTDYAFCNNLTNNKNRQSSYMLRTSGYQTNNCYYVQYSGGISDRLYTSEVSGVRPVIRCSLISSNSSHVHSYKTTIIEPTCTEKGFTEYYCFGCGDKIIGDYTNALGHDYSTEIITQSATCTESGTKLLICGRCNDRHTEVIEATGHSPVIETVKEPSCAEPGIQYEKCSVCGERLGEDTEISATGNHSWHYSTDKYTITASCETCDDTFSVTAVLPETLKCSDTPKEITVDGEIPDDFATNISYDTDDGQAPTKAGTYTAYFDLRRNDLTDAILARIEIGFIIEHDTVSKEGKEPTCTDEGYEPYEECNGCDYTTYKSISALGHSYKATYEWSEDCKTCKATAVCENNPEHTFSEEATASSAVKVKPTCTESGITTYTAGFNNKFFYGQQKDVEDISPKGHTVTVAPAKEATCDEKGLTEGSYCSACGEIFVEQKETPKLNHIDLDNNGYCDLCNKMMTGGEHCSHCGQIHSGFFGGIIKFFHQILHVFSR